MSRGPALAAARAVLTEGASLASEPGLWAHGLPWSWHAGSAVEAPGLQATSSSGGSWAQPLLGVWGLPESGIKVMFLALAGDCFTARPPGKPPYLFLIIL